MKFSLKFLLILLVTPFTISGVAQNSGDEKALKLYDEILATRNPNKVLELMSSFDLNGVEEDSLKAYLLYYKGTALGQLGQFDSSISLVTSALEILPPGHPIIEIQIHRAFGNIYWSKSYFNLSLDSYQRALGIAEELNNGEFQVSLLGNIAGIYAKLDNYKLALDYAYKAEGVSSKSGIQRPRSHMKIGTYLIAIEEYQKGIESLQETVKRIKADQRDSIALGVCYDGIAEAYLGLKKLSEARENLNLANQILTEVGYQDSYHHVLIAKLELLSGNLTGAREQQEKALDMANQRGDLTQILKVKEFEKGLMIKMGSLNQAINVQDEIIALKDSLKSQQIVNRVYELETQFATEKKEAEIVRLNLEGALKDANLARARNAQYAMAIGGGAIIVVLIVFFTLRHKKIVAEREAQELQVEALKKRFMELHASPSELAVAMDMAELNGKLHTELTEREFDALKLSIEGKSNTEISDKLFISVSTVKFHLRNAYGKMGVGNRKEAFQFMLKSS